MHPLLAFAGVYGPRIASWLLAHSSELGDAGARVVRPVMAALTDPGASVDRIGSTLVSLQNGQVEVIGLLHQHTTRLDGIGVAVDGVGRAVDNVAQSIGVLTSLTMVGLGLSVLSQVHVALQFAALTRRIKTIDHNVQAIQQLLMQDRRGRLDRGLDDLYRAEQVAASDPSAGRGYIQDARTALADSRASYARQLAGLLGQPNPEQPAYIWMVARHLTAAALGEATCYLRRQEPRHAADVLRSTVGALRAHATAVFGRTVGGNPARYLMPAMAPHGITLDVIAELYRQAHHANVINKNQAVTAADVFEFLRARLDEARDPRFGRASKVERLRIEFAEASAAIEEVNRLHGLALVIDQCARTGQDYLAVTEQVRAAVETCHPAHGACFAVFPPL